MQRILAIHLGALGDLLLSFPALFVLKKSYGARLTLFCQSAWAEAATCLGLAEETRPIESAAFSTLFSPRPDGKLADRLSGYDQAVVFSSSAELYQNIAARVPKAVQVPPRPPLGQPVHAATHVFSHLVRQGLLEQTPDDPADALPSFPAFFSKPDGPVLIHPGSGSPRKNWSLDRYAKLGAALETQGVESLFLPGPAEQGMAGALIEYGVEAKRIVPADSIGKVLELIKTARGYAGNDSGISHLAGLCGLPAVCIFGPSDPVRWKPVGKNVRVVRPELSCAPCFETEEHNCESPPPCFPRHGDLQMLAAFLP
ncbi:MAG: glycosyltransferase family 9 protein [Thermodesulfobacteriota bacterium]